MPHREIYALSDSFKFFRSEQLILIDKSGPGREIFFCRRIIAVIIPMPERIPVVGSVPGHKLKTILGMLCRKHRSIKLRKAAVVSRQAVSNQRFGFLISGAVIENLAI